MHECWEVSKNIGFSAFFYSLRFVVCGCLRYAHYLQGILVINPKNIK